MRIVVVGAREPAVQITVSGATLALGQVLALSDILVAVIGPALLDWVNVTTRLVLDRIDLALPNRAANVQYSHWAGKVTGERNFSERTLGFKILDDAMT